MQKRFLMIFTALALCLSLLPCSAMAASTAISDDTTGYNMGPSGEFGYEEEPEENDSNTLGGAITYVGVGELYLQLTIAGGLDEQNDLICYNYGSINRYIELKETNNGFTWNYTGEDPLPTDSICTLNVFAEADGLLVSQAFACFRYKTDKTLINIDLPRENSTDVGIPRVMLADADNEDGETCDFDLNTFMEYYSSYQITSVLAENPKQLQPSDDPQEILRSLSITLAGTPARAAEPGDDPAPAVQIDIPDASFADASAALYSGGLPLAFESPAHAEQEDESFFRFSLVKSDIVSLRYQASPRFRMTDTSDGIDVACENFADSTLCFAVYNEDGKLLGTQMLSDDGWFSRTVSFSHGKTAEGTIRQAKLFVLDNETFRPLTDFMVEYI